MAAPAAPAAPAPPVAAVLAASLFRPGPAPILGIGGQQLAPLTYNPQGLTVLAMPGVDILFVRQVQIGITPKRIAKAQPSIINALLIQSRGQ
ncbi:hypothetical protein EV356DRAFT_571886 [Viridothelium virens]|uniref:Uncharacterized protein n=1 Tax=Viridothelium virens TaxID=1048519 RepID=A0A6A6GRS2_VIRVR|nr:hypothetical protein EV356DRAFT_571886 [Viridothelium virens]